MARATDILVVPRNLRWEVVIHGVTRPLVDWFATKDRAVEHAVEAAKETAAMAVVIETVDGGVEAVLPLTAARRAS